MLEYRSAGEAQAASLFDTIAGDYNRRNRS
jgi:hypothetical protein